MTHQECYEPVVQLAYPQTQTQQQPSVAPVLQREGSQAATRPTHQKLPTKFLTNDVSWLSRQQDAAVPSPHSLQHTSGAQPWFIHQGYQVALV